MITDMRVSVSSDTKVALMFLNEKKIEKRSLFFIFYDDCIAIRIYITLIHPLIILLQRHVISNASILVIDPTYVHGRVVDFSDNIKQPGYPDIKRYTIEKSYVIENLAFPDRYK